MSIDRRFLAETGTEIFTGNELLVKGALETPGGVHLLTGYPGSPLSGFFDTLESIGHLLNERGVVAKIANNEALSVAMVNGAQMAGCRAITAFKSVGLHVASDALALGVLAGVGTSADADGTGTGGGLIVCGDDPWCDSTQVPADSRFLAEHVRMPVIEPCCPQEVKDWVSIAFKVGQAGQIYIGYLMTVAVADGGGTVQCKPNYFPKLNTHNKATLDYQRDIEPTLERGVLLPPRSWRRELVFDQRFAAVKEAARIHGVNRILHGPQRGEVVPMGFVASGVAYAYLAHALAELGLTGRIPILKLGMSYPVDEQIVSEFAQRCGRLVVIEERRSFVERQIAEVLRQVRQPDDPPVEVYGKTFPNNLPGIPSTRGLNPSVLIERLVPLLREVSDLPGELTNGRLSTHLDRIQQTGKYEVKIPDRSPAFCPGCPHRDSSSVLLELRRDLLDPHYMLQQHKRGPVDLVSHGDTGCYTMLMFEPNKPLMHNYSGMGLGGGTGSGADPFIKNKQLVFMGDGTFFHSGQTAISNSIQTGQDITYIILENKTTAMTGHQTNPGLEHDLTGQHCDPQSLERIVRAMVPAGPAKDVRIVRINPADRERYRNLMEQTILADGVKIVIADKECGITFHRRARADELKALGEIGYLPKKTHMNIATEACEHCLECTQQTGCPGLKLVDTDYGPKMQTDFSWCVNDGACQRIDACPAFEEVTIVRRQAPRQGDEHVNLADLPDPPRPIHANQDTWRCHLAGVGGMGIGLATAILVTAGHKMGYDVRFLDKKGLAIRNGGVLSQIVFRRQTPTTQSNGPGVTVSAADTSEGIDGGGKNRELTTPSVPYGSADLLLGVDLLESARGLDPNLPYRVASPGRTAAILNTYKTPTIQTLMGQDDFSPQVIEATVRKYVHREHCFGFNVGDLCERVLDSKLYVNIMMLGMAYQRGFLPITGAALEQAIRSVIKRDVQRNLRAFHIGRKVVIDPTLFVVEPQHEYESSRKAVRRKLNTYRHRFGRSRRTERTVKQFRVLLRQTFRATRGQVVEDQLMRDVVIRAYDCLIWGGIDYARQYCDRLVEVFRKDHIRQGLGVTRAVVWNLAKVMLIKDEIYVAAQLTSPEKYKRDRRRFNVNPAAGDKIIYRHHNRPEFVIFGQTIRFRWHSRDWQLRLLARSRFLRKLAPKWHRREREFRDWYDGLVAKLDTEVLTDRREYERWTRVLDVPEPVTGYREVRYPKMEQARRVAEELLNADPSTFKPQVVIPTGQHDAPADRTVHLPVLSLVGT